MNEKGQNRLYILMGIIFIFSGIALMFFPLIFIESISSPIAVLTAATGVSRSFQAVIRPKNDQSFRDRLMSFIVGVLQVVLAIWVWQYTEATLYWLLNFIGYYQLLMGLISLISYAI